MELSASDLWLSDILEMHSGITSGTASGLAL